MKAKFITLIIAACCLAAVSSCNNAEVENRGKADANGLIELSVKGVLGEFRTEETKSSLVNNLRVGWANDDKVLVFHKESKKYLGVLTAAIIGTDDRTAMLSGTIAAPEGSDKTLVFVHGTGLQATDFTEGASTTSVTLDLSSQSEKTPFLVFGTAPYVAQTIDNIIVDFNFATSVVSTYAAGLPASTAVTKADLSSINTKCVLDISTLAVSGSEPGTITKTAGISSTNAEGQVLFEIAVPESAEAASDRSVVFTVASKAYTAVFSKGAIAAGKAYSAMSENHSVEDVVLDKTSITISPDAHETLTATVYPEKSNQDLTWTSSNDAVSTVDVNGIVTGVAAGTAIITAASQDDPTKTASCTVTVKNPVTGVSLKTSTTISRGANETFTATVTPSTATNKALTWTSSNTAVATVDQTGKVTGIALGTATITATSQDDPTKTASCAVTVDSHEYVVIGGLKWATMNIGATTVAGSPSTCYGDLYSWGETSTKTNYAESYYTSTAKALSSHINPGSGNDVARVKWGGNWRMPTKDEFQALYDACGGTSTPKSGGSTSTTEKGVYWCGSYNGVVGLLFCDGAGHKLFFPAAGYSNSDSLSGGGSYGYYWSSTWDGSEYAYDLYFLSSTVRPASSNRYSGRSVRPVSD